MDATTTARSEPANSPSAANGPVRSHEQELQREAVTMALYVGLSLLAVMVALPKDVAPASSDSPAAVLFFTSLGLLFAHQLAYRVSARLAHRGQLLSEHVELLAAQLVGGLAVTGIAVVPVVFVDGPAGVLISELLLIAFIAVVSYVAARAVPVGRLRALGYAAGIIALTLVVLWIENLVDH